MVAAARLGPLCLVAAALVTAAQDSLNKADAVPTCNIGNNSDDSSFLQVSRELTLEEFAHNHRVQKAGEANTLTGGKSCSGSVRISKWLGRLGNNMEQLLNALLFAEQKDACNLVLPGRFEKDFKYTQHGNASKTFNNGGTNPHAEKECEVYKLFDLPNVITIKQQGKQSSWCNMPEEEINGNNGTFYHSPGDLTGGDCQAPFEEERRVMLTYVKAHAIAKVRTTCAAEKASAFQGVTIHFRGGDALREGSNTTSLSEFEQPPCAVYKKVENVLVSHNLCAQLRLVSQDNTNPCMAYVKEAFPGKIVPGAGSFFGDVCTILEAKHVVFSNSLFVRHLVLMNENNPTVVVPMDPVRPARKQFFWSDIVRAGCEGKNYALSILVPHLNIYRAPDEREGWMKLYSHQQLSVAGVKEFCALLPAQDKRLDMYSGFPPQGANALPTIRKVQ